MSVCKRPSKKSLDAAVRAAQLYEGSLEYTTMKQQQTLYGRMQRAVEKIAKTTGCDLTDVSEQIAKEARSRGVLRPMPGKDI